MGKILLIVHNIGNTLGQSKLFQENLSELVTLNFINLIATCENLTIPYYWTTEVKDKYKFCFIKFDTYGPYDLEIDENNSIKGGNNLKGGEGLKEIFSSLSETQKRLIKEIANRLEFLINVGFITFPSFCSFPYWLSIWSHSLRPTVSGSLMSWQPFCSLSATRSWTIVPLRHMHSMW